MSLKTAWLSSFIIPHSSLERGVGMLKTRLMLCLVVLASLALTAADATRAQSSRPELTEEFHQTYPLNADGRVSLTNINGDVRVAAWDRNEIKVDAVKRAYTQERLREAKINVEDGPSSVQIETEYPSYSWTRDDYERHENPASVEYTLTVPRGARLEDVSLVNGGLTIEGVAGSVHASSVNGRVVAHGLTGTVNLSVVNGRLEATLDRLNDSGTVSLASVNGPLVVTIPSDSNATLRASTIHGQISNDFNLPVREGEYVGRDLEGRLGQGGARERAEADRERQREIVEAQRETQRAAREAAKAEKDALKDSIKEEIRNGIDGGVHDDSRRQIERESNSFSVSGSPRVRVETFDGAIYVHAWDKAEVMYTATKRASDEHEMKGIKLSAQGAGAEVTLRADFDKSFARVYRAEGGRVVSFNSNASTEFDVYVPRNATLFVSSGDGRLRIDGVGGEIDLRTGDGSIDVTEVRGRLHAVTGDGRIRVENFDGDAEARTGDGRITLDGNFRSLAARTGDGTISLSIPEGSNVTVETNAESVFNDGAAVAESPADNRVRRWRIGSGGQVLTLHTGDGQIILRRR